MVLQFSLLGRKKPASRLRESCLSILGLYFESSLTWVSILRMWDVSWVLFSRKLGRNFRHRLRVAFACRGKVEGQAQRAVSWRRVWGAPVNTVWVHASWSADLIQEQCLEPVGAPENSSETSLPPWRQRAHARGGLVCSYVIQK